MNPAPPVTSHVVTKNRSDGLASISPDGRQGEGPAAFKGKEQGALKIQLKEAHLIRRTIPFHQLRPATPPSVSVD